MKIKQLFTIFVIFFCTTSCSVLQKNHHTSVYDILPRDSFTFINKSLIIKSCFNGVCAEKEYGASGSGASVAKNKFGTYIITAAHICEDKNVPTDPTISSSSTYQIISMKGEKHKAEVISTIYEKGVDICMLFAKGVYIDPVEIADRAPKAGDKIYNLAAPYSIGSPGAVPIMEGRYIGEVSKGLIAYSVPAAPGSSGSGLFNTRGELVGVLYAVYWKFHNICLSNDFDIMKDFIAKTVEEYNRILKIDVGVTQELQKPLDLLKL